MWSQFLSFTCICSYQSSDREVVRNRKRKVLIPYRTKQCRTKVTKFLGSDENFVRRKILSDESFVIFVFFENLYFSFILANSALKRIKRKILSDKSDEIS